MMKLSISAVLAFALASSSALCCNESPTARPGKPDIGYIDINSDITLRTMVIRNSSSVGTVLFLHGFPETLCVWRDISLELAPEFEIHAIDWPGYGFSSRPPAETFSYSPKDYALVLQQYIEQAGIDKSHLTIYATDIGALPALLLALEDPHIARKIIVGDFAPFDRPQYMYESLQNLKSEPSASATHAYMNKTSAEILENAFRRGLSEEAQFEVSADVKDEMFRGWRHGELTSADAFYHYYSNFTRDQEYFEANLGNLQTPVKVIWGDKDIYIRKEMGIELADKIGAELSILRGVGHYPHLQNPKQTIEEIRGSFR